MTRRKPGELFKDQNPAVIVKDEMIAINQAKRGALAVCSAIAKKSPAVLNYYKSLVSGGTLQEDSASAELYYMFRFDLLFNNARNKNLMALVRTARYPISNGYFTYLLSEYFKAHGLASEMVLATTWQGPRMNELLDNGDLAYLCNTHTKHDRLFSLSNLYAPAFYVPPGLEGLKDAVAVDTKGTTSYLANDYTQRVIESPASKAEDNLHLETLNIIPNPDKEGVQVARVTSLNGHTKGSIQQKLLLFEDFYNYERSYYGDTRSITQLTDSEMTTPQLVEELKVVLAKARNGQKEDFLAEAKEWFEGEISDQVSPTIINPGIRHTAPAFEYASAFNMNGVLKRGGNNYLLEVGKFIGKPTRIAEAQRNRPFDSYMWFPNTVRTEMVILIPKGYEADGLAALSGTISNKAGHFTSSAIVEGHTVRITVEKAISSPRYSASEWPQLLSITDAAADWTGAKLLLRKKD
jgi:hypothetical protein